MLVRATCALAAVYGAMRFGMRSDLYGRPAQMGRGSDYVYDEGGLAYFAALSPYHNQSPRKRVTLRPRKHATLFLVLVFLRARRVPVNATVPHIVSYIDRRDGREFPTLFALAEWYFLRAHPLGRRRCFPPPGGG